MMTRTLNSEWRRGWKPLLASTIGYGCGMAILSMSASLFIRPMQHELGWSTKAVAFLPLAMIALSFTTPLTGMIVDRFGSRRPTLIGISFFAFGLATLALVPISRTSLYTIAVGLGISSAFVSTTSFSRCIATWFDKNAGTAFGITMNGSALVAFLVVPVVSYVIQDWGWRAGFVSLSAVVSVIAIPTLYFLLKDRDMSADAHARPTASTSQTRGLSHIMRSWGFWSVLVAIALAGIPLGGFVGHIIPILEGGGLDITTATSLSMAYAVSISIGRLGGGFLLDRLWDGGVAAVLLAFAATGALLLAAMSPSWHFALILGAVLLVGIGQGLEADFVAYFALKMFGMQRYATVVAIYSMTAGLAMAAGGFLFSALFDAYKTYMIACNLGATCFLASGALLIIARWPARKATGESRL